jgi:integrase
MPRTRGSGSIYLQRGSSVWWVKYYRNGKPYRESTRTSERSKAQQFLRKRLAEITTGDFYGPRCERIRVDELAEDLIREYRINSRSSLPDVETRWRLHLMPFFGNLRAVDVSSDLLSRYVDFRQQQQAKNATINRELACLKRMYYLARKATPPKVYRVPVFSMLQEDNARKGFLEDRDYETLLASNSELWFRSILEVGKTYGWRISELLRMRVKQIELLSRTIRLEPGTTKNKDGREVTMTNRVYELLKLCVHAKQAEEYVFTRETGKPVREFRYAWWKACVSANLGKLFCPKCGNQVGINAECGVCEKHWSITRLRYRGLIFHDLRRTAARNLRRAGVAEGVIMKIGGWRTRSVFERYSIVSQTDIADAVQKLESPRNGHSFGHSYETKPSPTEVAPRQ